VTTSHRCCVDYMPVQRRVEFKIACFVHQSLTSKTPTCTSLSTFDLSSSMVFVLSLIKTLVVPRRRSSFGDRSFAAARPRLWNSLPTNLRQMTGYGQFRRHMISHLFRVFLEVTVTMIFCAIQVGLHLLTHLLIHVITDVFIEVPVPAVSHPLDNF